MKVLESKTAQLLQSVEKVAFEWACLNVDMLGEPAEMLTSLPLERRVRFGLPGENKPRAELVLRGSYGLGLELARNIKGLVSASGQAAEIAFTELTWQVAEDWRQRQRAETGLDLISSASQACTPGDWPPCAPEATLAAVVRGFAVEARLFRF